MTNPDFNLLGVSCTFSIPPTPNPAPKGGEKEENGDLPAACCRQIPEPLVFLPLPAGKGAGRWEERRDKTEILISGFVVLMAINLSWFIGRRARWSLKPAGRLPGEPHFRHSSGACRQASILETADIGPKTRNSRAAARIWPRDRRCCG
jgi:hypothetical protein